MSKVDKKFLNGNIINFAITSGTWSYRQQDLEEKDESMNESGKDEAVRSTATGYTGSAKNQRNQLTVQRSFQPLSVDLPNYLESGKPLKN